MAGITTGSIVSDIRGSVGDEIYSRNKYGAYVKAYAAPVQPDTSLQLARRAQMATAIAAWQALSDSERIAWNAFASGSLIENSVGKTVSRNGFGLFVSRKMVLLIKGLSDNPSPVSTDITRTWQLDFNALTDGLIQLTVNLSANADNTDLYIYMSPPVSSGIMSPNSVRFDFIRRINATSGLSSNMSSPYTSRFGSLAGLAGKKVFLKSKLVVVNQFEGSPTLNPFCGIASEFSQHGFGVIT